MVSDLRFDAHIRRAQETADRISGSIAPLSLSWLNITPDIQEVSVWGPYIFADEDFVEGDAIEPENMGGPTSTPFDSSELADLNDAALANALVAVESDSNLYDLPEDTSAMVYQEESVDFRWEIVKVSISTSCTCGADHVF